MENIYNNKYFSRIRKSKKSINKYNKMKKNIFWKNKNIFISGVAGFVGSNLAKNLVNNGSNVIGLTQNKKVNSLLYYENIDKKIDLIFGNITDKELLSNVFLKYKIDICFHLAAQVEVGSASKYPYLTWETNVRGTYTLLETIRESKRKNQIYHNSLVG